MKVLVTGARGHVGRHLVTRLIHTGHEVRAHVRRSDTPTWTPAPERISSGDLSDQQTACKAVGNADAVVHCAARVRDGKPDDFMSDNLLSMQNLGQAALDGELRFVHLSTVAAYGKKAHTQGTEDAPFAPGDDPYARSKVAAEQRRIGQTSQL